MASCLAAALQVTATGPALRPDASALSTLKHRVGQQAAAGAQGVEVECRLITRRRRRQLCRCRWVDMVCQGQELLLQHVVAAGQLLQLLGLLLLLVAVATCGCLEAYDKDRQTAAFRYCENSAVQAF